VRSVEHPVDGDGVDQDAGEQAQEGHDEQPYVRMHPGLGEEEIDAEHPQGDDRAVGQVDHPHHAPDQGEPHGGQAVNEAQQQPIDERGQQHSRIHPSLLPDQWRSSSDGITR
jgi:hypothetical protein